MASCLVLWLVCHRINLPGTGPESRGIPGSRLTPGICGNPTTNADLAATPQDPYPTTRETGMDTVCQYRMERGWNGADPRFRFFPGIPGEREGGRYKN